MTDHSHNNLADSRGRILVTGADGFTGRYLTPALEAARWSVTSGVRAADAPAGQATFDLADVPGMTRLLDEQKPQAIIHLAAISFAGHGNAGDIYHTNTIGTLNLLTAIEQADLQLTHLIIASSAAVYGQQTEPELHEGLRPNPLSDYGISKLAAEQIALARSTANNLIITRPFNYTGPLQDASFLIPKLVHHFVRREKTIELGNIDVAREFNDVRWAVDSYKTLLELKTGTQKVNLCSGNAFKLRDVLHVLEDITQHHPELVVNPQFVRENDPPLIKGSTKLGRSIGLPALPSNKTSALREMLEWMCSHYKSKE